MSDAREFDMQHVVDLVSAAGCAAYVEYTGGGCATIYASREWEDRPVTRMGEPAGVIAFPKQYAREDANAGHEGPYFDAIAGPGWFDGPNMSKPRATTGEFFIGPGFDDDVYEDVGHFDTDEQIAAAIVNMVKRAA